MQSGCLIHKKRIFTDFPPSNVNLYFYSAFTVLIVSWEHNINGEKRIKSHTSISDSGTFLHVRQSQEISGRMLVLDKLKLIQFSFV